MTLSPGAVQLPTSHVSARVAWHDLDWTGRVCHAPGQNHACTVLRNVKERKHYELEEEDAGRLWSDLDPDRVPPCALERAGFMRPAAFNLTREHAYAWNKHGAHAHFAPTLQHMPPYSLEITPFRWVMRQERSSQAAAWDIRVDEGLEREAEQAMGFSSDWIQDHRNQLALLDSFFSALRPQESLVLLYAKDVPLVEQPLPGDRFLIGAGFVEQVQPVVEWAYDKPGPLRSVMWERGVLHSIRPSFGDGFLLPYQQLLAAPDLQGEDLEPFLARAPPEHFAEFSYVSELVSHEGAIAALTELARVLDCFPASSRDHGSRQATGLPGAWRTRGRRAVPTPASDRCSSRPASSAGPSSPIECWESFRRDSVDPWPVLERAIEQNQSGLVGRTGRKAWARLAGDAERYRQLRVMSRLSLSAGQARRLFESLEPAEVIENPYRLYEADRRELEPVTLATVDRGLWPQDSAARAALEADPLPEPIVEAGDDRRVRAASVLVLEEAAEQGHTVLDEAGLRRRLSSLDLVPECDPPDALFELACDEFDDLLIERELARDSGRAWQLDRLAAATARIAAEVRARLEDAPLDVEWRWHDRIDHTIDGSKTSVPALSTIEQQARAEKADALRILARSRVAALIGPAGTGKTTMLEALCSDPAVKARGVLLLAPTGKARVQLSQRVEAPAQTVAQFLRPNRWLGSFGHYVMDEYAPRTQRLGATVVIDEASMLTEEMLAAVLDALADVDRLVLCGDPRQLPPIGAGRPFADIVAFLRDTEGPGGGSPSSPSAAGSCRPATTRAGCATTWRSRRCSPSTR